MLFGRVGILWGLNAMVTITALRVCGVRVRLPAAHELSWLNGTRVQEPAKLPFLGVVMAFSYIWKNKMFFAVLPNKIHQLAYHIFGRLA